MASRLTTDPHIASVGFGDVLQHIDWTQPWFAPWAENGQAIAKAAWQTKSVAHALNQLCSSCAIETGNSRLKMDAREVRQSMVFVDQAELPAGQAYEDFIFQHRRVPTRNNLHDFFNGLCWHRFAATKHRLNQLQAHAIAQQGIGSTRGPVRDALTLFDENAVLWQGPDELWQALQARDWPKLFVDLRALWSGVHIVLFGHALLEKLVTPYKSITGHVYRIHPNVHAHDDAVLDDWLAHDLQADTLATKPFEPLPVLGVPHWWADNAVPAFYQDTQVFRPKRMVAS